MKKTSIVSLIVLAVVGGVLAGVLELGLAVSGHAIIVPPLTLAVTLAVFGALIVSAAIPIRRGVTGKSHSRVDPFYALRVVMLAQASALGGSLLAGAGLGVIVYLAGLPVSPTAGALALTAATIVGAAVLLAGGLVAELMCRIPPGKEGDDDDEGDAAVRVNP